MGGADGSDVLVRLTRIEGRLDIEQLPIRYALAVDQRDLDAWVELFVPDVSLGRLGTGRESLRRWIEPRFRLFYRSVHQIVGHRVELIDSTTARGSVYSRAQHEVGDRWVVIDIRYDDSYRKVDGRWLFVSRRDRHFYTADLLERPNQVQFCSWAPSGTPSLPHCDESWDAFWSGYDTSEITSQPGPTAAEPAS